MSKTKSIFCDGMIVDKMCDCEMAHKNGAAPTTFSRNNWMYTIKRDERGWWSILINHKGYQEEIPIAFCPYCGKYLK